MARRPSRRQAATGTTTVVSPSDAGAGAGTRQPKTATPSRSAGDTLTPDKGRTRQTIITAKDKPYVETKITNTGARKKPKGWGKQGDARKAPKADDDRLWDPSKGIKMPSKQIPTLTASQPDGSKSATSNRAAGANISHKTPTTPTVSEARLRNSKMAEMTTYLVADTCDPDSFDRGGIVQVSYEASKSSTTTPKTSPNSQEQRGRKRHRGRNRNRDRDSARVNDLWDVLAEDQEFSQMVALMDRQMPFRSPSPECYEEPIRPPSNALLEWLASTDDRLFGRLIYQPGTASGGNYSKGDNVPSSPSGPTVAAAETTSIDDYCVQMLDQMMGRLYTSRPSCLFPRGSNGSVTDSVTLAGIGDQFVFHDYDSV
ncbi:hypothetical protein QBC37DRAFT_394649 [Rhypophila decipiens]|uniref:Uncharacterized protein n=1 Tax=Rhypophila decipiens TaxID=261697 RepID=A0AAN7BBI4_9PEZI|nr:hypothetical protein QBC37DRAFT_394649 [Rhypophila decipiens]